MTKTASNRIDTLPPSDYFAETFTTEETAVLERYFTNTTRPVFALINMPEVVKGALFARYSRSPKSIRRLFLDEFSADGEVATSPVAGPGAAAVDKAESLYQRVVTQFGDDSVAQLGSAHLACEQSSNILTKILEWGRLASYLEQSTRYIYYDRPLGGRYRYLTPPEVAASPLALEYRSGMDDLFDTYAGLTERLSRYYEALYPREDGDSTFVYDSSIRARTCDDLRGLLPASTLSNVGIHGSGQAFEMLIMRMRAHPLAEARHYGGLMLEELRKVIPAFLRRVDMPDRGDAWSDYLADTAARIGSAADALGLEPEERAEVTLVDWDPEAETKLAAAALYAHTDLPDDQLLSHVRGLPADEIARLVAVYFGERGNRRHKPGRGLERSSYRFDVLCDYGIFRDLQRHRMLTLEWQRLGTRHGYVVPDSLREIEAEGTWHQAMEKATALHDRLTKTVGGDAAQYAVPFAFRIRFFMQLNAREAFHLIELRSGEGGHRDYRRVAQEMHRLIGSKAGHNLIADGMRFVDYGDYDLDRLTTERRAAARRTAAGIADPEA